MKMDSKPRALDKIYKRRDRYEIPEWQRQEVWSRSKKQNLIDTILRGWKLPKFYFLKTGDDPEEFEVVDGQQRLVAIFEFFDNDLPLAPASAKEFGGEYYKDLPETVQDNFGDYEIEFDLITQASDDEVKSFFQRLQEGLPLTSSEKLNSIHSKFRDFVSSLAKHSFFMNKISVSDMRYGHFDIAAKVAAIEIDGLEVGTRYDDLRAVFESQASFSSNSNVAKRIKGALDFLDSAFDERNPRLRNRTVVQSVLTLCARLWATGNTAGSEKRIGKFINIYDPSFAALFDSATFAEIGLSHQIRSDAEAIATYVGSANERYAADHGEDLFKPTNKTVLSQIKVGKVINSFEEYKTLIENLYFLFHEGVGTRLEGKKPQSFKDVNDLRTAVNHDVDHGTKGKVKAKKKKLGDVFKNYSGVSSPEALAPELFQVVQVNILSALRKDLENLKW